MSSIPGLPPVGSDVTVLVTRVNLNANCVLVELWANFNKEREAEYKCMERSIQYPGELFREQDGDPGDQCLACVDDTWFRTRIVSRNGNNYTVFLIDKGWIHGATTNLLAWGKKDYFLLPPEVEFCVLSNILPLSPDNRWSPMALQFLDSLSGMTVRALVQDVLVPQRTFLLHIACISKQMHEMGFAKCLSPPEFNDYVLKSVHSDNRIALSPGPPQQSTADRGEPFDQQQSFMYVELPIGIVETVIITEVTSPLRVFCQLKVCSQELKKLSEKLTKHYEGRTSSSTGPDTLGSPCAARGNDGKWYRSVVRQILPANNAVEVFNVDSGKKQFVLVDNVKPLAAEFFRMPVVTYITSLHGIIDKGVGWTAGQIDQLRSLLLCQTVVARFEYHSLSEGVHYVTLYGQDNKNLNTLFGSTERCLLESEKLLVDNSVDGPLCKTGDQAPHEGQGDAQSSPKAVKLVGRKTPKEQIPVEDLPLGSSLVVVVLRVSSPSEFWIQTQKYAIEFDHLMAGISDLDRDPVNPTVGSYCAARLQDGLMYRSRVVEVRETKIKVFLVDYGKTEVVDQGSICFLPDKFRELPQLALQCKLAGVKPRNERWTRTEVDFFTRSVTDKLLHSRVVTQYDGGYGVRLTDSVAHGEKDVGKLMCSYDIAVQDDAQSEDRYKVASPHAMTTLEPNRGAAPLVVKDSISDCQTQNPVDLNNNEGRPATLGEQRFAIGSTLEVNVSCIDSPNDFWCQLTRNMTFLGLLMQDLQTYYAESQFSPFAEKLCVARHPDDGMWYRAIVIHRHVTRHVNVLFVDFGKTQAAVPLCNLRKICPAFLKLKGQAFRCSLYNPEEPLSPIKDWNQEARAQFKEFVETAVSKHVDLKCTVYATMYSEQKVLHNIVDLETPFESVCTRMLQLSKSTPPKKIPAPLIRLDTYCYSAHNIKMGTEEMMTVTSVDSANQFYCQLDRNFDVVEDLTVKLQSLCERLKNAKLPTLFGTVCFAKYPDGHWYRGLIKATKPSIRVFFVDYGDTLEVDKAGILPVPMEATEIMMVPVQAIECGLADVPANVQSEVNSWFKTKATDGSFRGLVVAKEPCGKLLVELYDETSQVNSEIRKTFLTALPKGVPELKDNTQAPKRKPCSDPKPVPHLENDVKVSRATSWSENRHSQRLNEKSEHLTQERYKTPHQRNMASRIEAGQQWTDQVDTQPIEQYVPEQRQQRSVSHLHCTESQRSKVVLEPKKPAPKQSEKPRTLDVKVEPLRYLLPNFSEGQKLEAYVATIKGPHTFWCQPADGEELDRITHAVSELGNAAHKPLDPKLLSHGSACVALFTDEQWYRAEVRSLDGSKLSAHFVDYGNDSQVNIKDVREITSELVKIKAQAFLCELDGFDDANGSWTEGAVEHIAELMTDKLLELTVMKVLGEDEGEFKCIVQVLCEGNKINATARSYWRSSRTENNIDSTELSAVHPTLLPCDSAVQDTTMPQSKSEAEEPEHHTMEKESPRDPPDEQHTVGSEKSEEPSILSEVAMVSELTSESLDQTTHSPQSDSVGDEEVPVLCEAQPGDGAAPLSDKDEACQPESLSTDDSVIKPDQDCQRDDPQVDDKGSGPDQDGLEDTPATLELDLDSEFGGLRVAEALPVGAMCIIRSQTSQRWCRAIILKNLPDQTLVVLIDEEREMVVRPDAVFESVVPRADQLDANNNQSSDPHSVPSPTQLLAGELSDDSEGTLVGVEEMTSREDGDLETSLSEGTPPRMDGPLPVQDNGAPSAPCGPSQPGTAAPDELLGTVEEVVHPSSEEVVHPSSEEVVPCTQEEVVNPSSEEVVPCTREEVVPCTQEEVVPCTQEEVVNPSSEEVVPCTREEVVPCTREEVVPCTREEVVPCTREEVVPCTQEEVVPCTREEVVHPSSEEVVPCTQEEVVNPSSEEVVPCTQEEVVNPSSEEVVNPSSEEVVNPSSEEVVNPSSEEVVPCTQEEVVPCTREEVVNPSSEEGQQRSTQALSCPTEKEVQLPLTDAVLMPSTKEEVQVTPLAEEVPLPSSDGEEELLPSRLEGPPLAEEVVVSPDETVMEQGPSPRVGEPRATAVAAGRELAGDERPTEGRPLQGAGARGPTVLHRAILNFFWWTGLSSGPGPEDEEQGTPEIQPIAAPRRDAEDLMERVPLGSAGQSLEAQLSSVTHLSLVIHGSSENLTNEE
ncbi:tudor domain-containing 6 isoform X13 [Gadus chalcogrammus]|uniref:tudor domain-containing 6 isoform X13 n=1 Tax=Gadus chalcogrammus TaxID=1042646 RepID=UPI0024C4CEC3|nr:tudor domain-containing 6 isoform X13 [Gadus chalcogrammus]